MSKDTTEDVFKLVVIMIHKDDYPKCKEDFGIDK